MTSPDAAVSTRRPGRPRDARADEAILQAAAQVLGGGGPQGFTVDAVAAAAGVGKATIYRRWPTRAALLLAAASRVGMEVPHPDTGSLRDDLVLHLQALGRKMTGDPGRLFAAIVAEASVNDDMRSRLRGFLLDRRSFALGLIQGAMARGELPAHLDPDEVLDLLGAPIFVRLLTGGVVDDAPFIEQCVDIVLTGAGYTPTPRRDTTSS